MGRGLVPFDGWDRPKPFRHVAFAAHVLVLALVVAPAALAAEDGASSACPPARVGSAGFGDVSLSSPHLPRVDCVAHWGLTQGVGVHEYGARGT